MEAVAEFIPTKLRVPREILAIKKKRDDVKTASVCNKRNPTNANAQKLKKAQRELTTAYLKEQAEYIQVNNLTDLFENIKIDDILSFLRETELYQKT